MFQLNISRPSCADVNEGKVRKAATAAVRAKILLVNTIFLISGCFGTYETDSMRKEIRRSTTVPAFLLSAFYDDSDDVSDDTRYAIVVVGRATLSRVQKSDNVLYYPYLRL